METDIITLLKKTKENYQLTNRGIAMNTDINERTISSWLKGYSKPDAKNTEILWNFFEKWWQSGLIQYSAPYSETMYMILTIPVRDIKNPIDTYDPIILNRFSFLDDNYIRSLILTGEAKIIELYPDYNYYKYHYIVDYVRYNYDLSKT